MINLRPWERELSEFISVTVDGAFDGVDPDVTGRTPGRVVVVMPDFTADAVAHALSDLGELADRVRLDREWTGERELAAALREAAESAGYRCPDLRRESPMTSTEAVRPESEAALRRQVGRRLLGRRVWLGLSQDEVACRARVTRNFVSAIERGAQGLDAWRLWAVADALGLGLDWLLMGPDEALTAPVQGETVVRSTQ